jgi:tetratricopeptide (TPR) repeat protein
MSAHPLPSGDRAAAENELLARLGLPPSASPEDVDQLHLAVSQYLAAAPAGLKGWAHAQAAALDEAYLQLTDPVGLQGSALRSSTRPPTVVPGGPATPPARRDPVPAAPAVEATAVPADEAVADPDDLDALYASVTPSAHRDMAADAKATPRPPRRGKAAATMVAPAAAPPASSGPWKKIALGVVGIAAVVGVMFVVYNLGGGGSPAAAGTGSGDTAQASPSGPTVDLAQVQTLMTKLQANPSDTATMQALGDLYYQGADYTTAGSWYDKVLAIDAKNVKALLARGAVYFNLGDLANAQKSWAVVVSVDPKNQEVHYDLGFLYLNQPSPNWSGVQSEWKQVIAIDSTTSLAQLVQQHLDSLVAASMIPAPSGGTSATPSGSPAASGAASPAPSAAPSASPAPSAGASSQP